eukprot:gi/632982484/ref/XP_007908161.1/ PREDICTED: heme-binding protein 1-like [Callorhinchus milii]
MFGMIRNSLFGGTEIRPCQTLSSETKGDFSYEVRKYEPAKYASVTVTGKPFDEASGEGVLKLLKYVGGSNEQGVGMGMTAPVTIRAHRGDQGGLQPGVLVQIRIPSKYQEQPPRPTDQSITVQHQEGFTVYSTHFGGYAKEADWVEHAGNLCAALGEQAAYHREHFLCAGYDPPMKPLGRRNEVWLVRQEPPE